MTSAGLARTSDSYQIRQVEREEGYINGNIRGRLVQKYNDKLIGKAKTYVLEESRLTTNTISNCLNIAEEKRLGKSYRIMFSRPERYRHF